MFVRAVDVREPQDSRRLELDIEIQHGGVATGSDLAGEVGINGLVESEVNFADYAELR